ncbi:hypothetical protein BZJ20_16005 [Salinivibrio proteolyticus]|nr:hypothetical protein BZJ20_16005 [Salinivibrio proteolyticus]
MVLFQFWFGNILIYFYGIVVDNVLEGKKQKINVTNMESSFILKLLTNASRGTVDLIRFTGHASTT